MKKFLCFLSLCVMLMSCNSDFGDCAPHYFKGKDISGLWVTTRYIGDGYQEDYKYVYDGYMFDGDKIYGVGTYSDYLEFKNGYIYGPSDAIETAYWGKFTLNKNGNLYVDGEYDCKLSWQGDKLIKEGEYSSYVLERVKGFKD